MDPNTLTPEERQKLQYELDGTLKGAKIAGVISAILFSTLIIALIYFLFKRAKK